MAKRSARTSASQYDTLMDFMQTHERFARGQLSGQQGRQNQASLYEELATLLNQDATGPAKDAGSWKKVWIDWKCNIRKKKADETRHNSQTGAAPKLVAYSHAEERLLQFLGPAAVFGNTSVREGGFPVTHLPPTYEDEGSSTEYEEYEVLVDDVDEVDEEHAGPSQQPAAQSKEHAAGPSQEKAPSRMPKRKRAKGSERLESFVNVQNQHVEAISRIASSLEEHIAPAMVSLANSFVVIAETIRQYLGGADDQQQL